jgi:ABC-type nitrate/sulfonate/bicarbonate transport system ATPase subunit
MSEASKPTGSAETAVVELRGVRLSFDDDVEVLRDVTLSVRARDRIVILGQSGGGKSTLLAWCSACSGRRRVPLSSADSR